MNEALEFIKEYSNIYKTERYLSLIVSIITLILLLTFFSYQIFIHKDSSTESWTTIVNSFVGLGSTGIITISIGYIYKFMDKALEATKTFINNQNKLKNEE